MKVREKETIKSYFFAVSDNAHTLNNNNLM